MTGILLVAAGGSTRLGRPKQLVEWNGKPLLRHAAETAVAAGMGPVLVVLGAVDQPCRDCLAGLDLTIVHHPDWEQGMGGSIAAGMRVARQWPLDGIIVMLCDQPFITPEHLRQLGAESTRHRIVNTSCDGQSGPPAWFSPAYFDQLCSLSGNRGAKALIEGESRRAQIDFPDAKWDIDTAEDLAVLAPRIDPD